MGLLSLSETIDLFHEAESIIQLPFDKLSKIYEKMFHRSIDEVYMQYLLLIRCWGSFGSGSNFCVEYLQQYQHRGK